MFPGQRKVDLAVSQESPCAIDPSEIRAQLERILKSPDFDVPERAQRFLEYVVTETLSGRADRIKAYTIAVEVFGRDESFDPQSDPLVRIEAGRVRRGLERYYLTSGSSDPIVITIPKGGYVPAFSLRTAEERAELAEVKPGSYRELLSQKKPLLALAGIAAIVFVLSTWAAMHWLVIPRSAPPLSVSGPNIPKLLVETFQDVSATTESAVITNGLTEEVIGKLAHFKELVVVVLDPSRHDPSTLPAQADSAMTYLLTGSVQVEGDAIRLSTRLVDRTDGSVLWANDYDGSRKVGRLLDIEADIAGDVATALGQPNGVIFESDATRTHKRPPEEWDAYACTLAYYSYRMVLDEPTHGSVKQCLERTVQRFPDYATAWALLSLIYIDELRFRYRPNPKEPSSLDQASDAARRAMALDSTNTRAIQARMLSLFFKGDVDAALKVGERGVALNPNDSELVGEYGMRLALSGEWSRGCAMIERAVERIPAPLGFDDLGLAVCSYMQGDYQQATFRVRKADLEKNPIYHFVAAAIYGELGDAAAAERERQWILTNASELLHDIRSELRLRLKTPRDQEHFLDGLKRAGLVLPES
jgi:TolB-like protein/tetratricopeptide (TPR) repeat protein